MTDHPFSEDAYLPLSDMVEALRVELQRSLDKGRDQAVRFDLDKVELELKVAVSNRVKADGSIGFWVLKAGAAAEGQRDASHTFKLTLKPVAGSSGQALQIGDEADRPLSRQ